MLDAAWTPDLLASVIPGGSLDAAAALDVYRTGYVVRLTDQLGETYASVWRVLGDEEFFAVCRDYISAHVSTSTNLSDYGGDFPAFVAASAHAIDYPFLAELARFEWMFHGLFHAPTHLAVPVEQLAALVDLTGVRFRLGSAVRLFDGQHRVYEVFRHRQADDFPEVDLAHPQRVLMFKQGSDVLAREIDAATQAALEALSRGLAVEDAIACAAKADANFGEAAVARLFEIIALCGLVTAIER